MFSWSPATIYTDILSCPQSLGNFAPSKHTTIYSYPAINTDTPCAYSVISDNYLNTNILFIKTWDRHPNCFVEGHASRCCVHSWQSDYHPAVATIDGSIFHLTNMNICFTTAHVSTCKLSISGGCGDVRVVYFTYYPKMYLLDVLTMRQWGL